MTSKPGAAARGAADSNHFVYDRGVGAMFGDTARSFATTRDDSVSDTTLKTTRNNSTSDTTVKTTGNNFTSDTTFKTTKNDSTFNHF